MSSNRKRAAIQKALNEADALRQQLILLEFKFASMETVAHILAEQNRQLKQQIAQLTGDIKHG